MEIIEQIAIEFYYGLQESDSKKQISSISFIGKLFECAVRPFCNSPFEKLGERSYPFYSFRIQKASNYRRIFRH